MYDTKIQTMDRKNYFRGFTNLQTSFVLIAVVNSVFGEVLVLKIQNENQQG